MDSVRRTSLGSRGSIEAPSPGNSEAESSRIERLNARKRVAQEGVELVTGWASVVSDKERHMQGSNARRCG